MPSIARLSLGLLLALALAEDVEGAKDHPLVGRYQGATAVSYKVSEFDEAALLQAPHDYNALLERNAQRDRSGPDWLKLEGRVTEIRYEGPEGRSSLEVQRNFEKALEAKGFAKLFACADQSCLEGKLRDPYLMGEQLDTGNGNSTAYFDHARYLLAKGSGASSGAYVAILTGEYRDQLTTFVKVVETKAMEADKIAFVDAGQIGAAIGKEGRVNLYGILFDFDSAEVKPESTPTLGEIAKTLGAEPGLKLTIIGHTDNKGTAPYNLDLSERRAARVVALLVHDFSIAPDRLSSSGAGLSAPIASNDTEEGRAKNRRVELVAK